jgi:2-keto-4-pentenoate hydratase/2-oxohepta-3-ene-1,7-dioic acid hydratase in catechol pathway
MDSRWQLVVKQYKMKIICIGRNYVEHARELNHPVPAEPIFFLKPDSSLLRKNRPFYYPDFSQEIHYEAEIVVRICKTGKYIEEKLAPTYYDSVAIGIDFTARDVQQRAKEKGLPWTKAKGFDGSAPISPFIPLSELPPIDRIGFHLTVNGQAVQRGNTGEMIFPVDRLISDISRYMTLKTGDLIFTGTPSGVGPVKVGDRLEVYIEGRKMLWCEIK